MRGQRRRRRPGSGAARGFGARMSVRILRWVTGCVAAVSVALLAGGIALSYAERDIGPLTRWDFSMFSRRPRSLPSPVVGYVLASRRPGNRIGWIILGAGLVVGVAFFCDRLSRGGLLAASGALPGAPGGRVVRELGLGD